MYELVGRGQETLSQLLTFTFVHAFHNTFTLLCPSHQFVRLYTLSQLAHVILVRVDLVLGLIYTKLLNSLFFTGPLPNLSPIDVQEAQTEAAAAVIATTTVHGAHGWCRAVGSHRQSASW